MSVSGTSVSDLTPIVVPSTAAVKTIATLTDPILRNLQITQCYSELSHAFARRTGGIANWCSYATWASKQAGQTIRNEDLQRTLEALIKKQSGVEDAMLLTVSISKNFGAKQTIDFLRRCSVGRVVNGAAKRAADAVSRGNKKVFEEIAFEFARFIHHCFQDVEYAQENIDRFCEGLRSGGPPDGQEYLQQAFCNYYRAFFEKDAKEKAECCLLANLQIGFHEQTRLQPEIAEALNAAVVNTSEMKDQLLTDLFRNSGLLTKLRLFFQRLFGTTGLLHRTAEELMMQIQLQLRIALTAHLMTLTMPPDKRLHLGKDLSMVYHDDLKELKNSELLKLLLR